MAYDPVTIREAAQIEVLLFVGLAFVGALGVIFWGFQTYQFGRLIRDTPTGKVRSVAMGRAEVEGDVIPATKVYDQPFSEGQCVYYEYEVKEYREDSDDDGKSWQTIQRGESAEPFYIDDGTGQILVDVTDGPMYEISDTYKTEIEVGGDPESRHVREFLGLDPEKEDSASIGEKIRGAIGTVTGLGRSDGSEADAETGDTADASSESEEGDTGDRTADAEKPPEELWEDVEYTARSELSSVGTTHNKRRYIQRVLPLGEQIYVYGGAERTDVEEEGLLGEDVLIRTDPGTEEFIISDQGEFQLASIYTKRAAIYIVAGIIVSVFILAILVQILITGPVYGPEAAKP